MKPLDSRAVSESLESYIRHLLAESDFVSGYSRPGQARREHVRDVFGQYYLWRNRFHRWVRRLRRQDRAVGEALNVSTHALASSSPAWSRRSKEKRRAGDLVPQAALGIKERRGPRRVIPRDRHLRRVRFRAADFRWTADGDRGARRPHGRELVGPSRNRIVVGALPEHYGVACAWISPVLPRISRRNTSACVGGAGPRHQDGQPKAHRGRRLEIWEHIASRDGRSSAVGGCGKGGRPVKSPLPLRANACRASRDRESKTR